MTIMGIHSAQRKGKKNTELKTLNVNFRENWIIWIIQIKISPSISSSFSPAGREMRPGEVSLLLRMLPPLKSLIGESQQRFKCTGIYCAGLTDEVKWTNILLKISALTIHLIPWSQVQALPAEQPLNLLLISSGYNLELFPSSVQGDTAWRKFIMKNLIMNAYSRWLFTKGSWSRKKAENKN